MGPDDLEIFFEGRPRSRQLFDALLAAARSAGEVEVVVTTSQVAFAHKRRFAFAWMPDQYLGPGHAPLVLTVPLRRRDPSPRWKEVVEPYPGRYTHHLELSDEAQIDEEVRGWLAEAWAQAG